jgi:hypothetical protein
VVGCLRPACWQLPVALALAAAIGAGVIVRSPAPRIDVFVLEQGGADALVNGANPYSITYPNPYSADETKQFFSTPRAELSDYPYPPLSLIATTLGYLAGGDVRWALLATQLAIAGLLFALARRNAYPLPIALAVLHLVHPRGPFVLEQAWTDSLPALAWLATLYWRNAPALGLFFAAKQYSFVALPLIVRDLPRRTIVIALAIAAAVTLPFALWDLHGFVEDVVVFQFHQPFRLDAMSVPALIAVVTGLQAPGLLSFASAGAATAWLYRKRAAAIAVCLVYLAFFLGATQAFCNYYYFVGVLLLGAAAQPGIDRVSGPEVTERPPGTHTGTDAEPQRIEGFDAVVHEQA